MMMKFELKLPITKSLKFIFTKMSIILGMLNILAANISSFTVPPGAKRPPCMASAFLGKYVSDTAVDLIQRKKLNFWNFYESNLTEARFEII